MTITGASFTIAGGDRITIASAHFNPGYVLIFVDQCAPPGAVKLLMDPSEIDMFIQLLEAAKR